MRIYKMTATFGKLEHAVLTLEPGLNIIEAPNEWGKSTWCAFLAAMLYGLDTRAKTTKTALADKERYAPWSGSPMAGRIDLRWRGRDITIERSTKGRVPLGEFRAYETHTGLLVEELTGANCGRQLLGVEQSVFRRAGFIRLNDMPVTQDEALRRRLNDLVTTGDETGAGDRLAKDLKELKNRCRYNRSGLLPQAEEERDALAEKLRELDGLENQCRKLKARAGEVRSWMRELENHRSALAYAEAEADAGRVAQARDIRDQAAAQLETLEHGCANLPDRETAERKLRELREFGRQWASAQMERRMLPDAPQPPVLPEPFARTDLERAEKTVRADETAYAALLAAKPGRVLFFLSALCILGAAVLTVLAAYLPAGIAAAAGLVLLALGFGRRKDRDREKRRLEEKYGSPDHRQWLAELERCREMKRNYELVLARYRASHSGLDVRLDALQKQRDSLCGGQSVEEVTEIWQQVCKRWEEYHAARREAQRAENHLQTLQAMAKNARRPSMADAMTYTEAETLRLIADAAAEQQRLQNRLGQYQGRMEALGDRDALETRLESAQKRIAALEETYAALTIAQETLAQARAELQRRFAPRISKRAQELLSAMTAGRYDRLALGEDFSLRAGAGEEDVLRDALWRSDGTVDQLYLALRLAVAEELTPGAPLVLDDALVRFDDARLKAALEILAETAQSRQVICFTCQSRERIWQTATEAPKPSP